MRGQKGPVITDDSFETLAFEVCNSDGVEGLSWAEVEQCQVSKYKYESYYIYLRRHEATAVSEQGS